ncbi:MAG: lysophospholipid acyltransferase family protein, partial [cyanobacterium endosymbiont of Rhopalodia yunnanensis]
SQIKILPVGIRYIQPYPSWGTDVTVTIGKPIEVAKYSSKKIKSSSEKLTDDLETILRELYQKQDPSESVAIAS